jgi:hypothetical protein
MKILNFLFILASLYATTAFATETEMVVGKFSSSDLTGWKDETVIGSSKMSTYAFIKDNGKTVLQGKSADSASGLLYKIKLDPKISPIIKWSWKIEHTVKNGNERIKDGHDFAARIYVVFPRGMFFWNHRAIEYVWGNVLPKGEIIRSPFSKNAVMIAVDSGNELKGKWSFHKRNYYEDYKIAFGEEPPKVGAIAIMTDSDNTHETSIGYYGDISFVSVGAKLEEPRVKELKVKEPAPKEVPQKEQKPKEQPSASTGETQTQQTPVIPPTDTIKAK